MLSCLKALLSPAPGRLEFALRLALICTVSAAIAEWYALPEVALTAYVGFFLVRADRTTSILMSSAMLILVSLLIGLLTMLLGVVIGRPAVLLSVMTLFSFAALFLVSSSKLQPIGGILALIVTYSLALIGQAPEGELAVRALLYACLIVLIPIGVSIAVNLLFGPAPRRLVERTLAVRLRAAAALLRDGSQAAQDTLSACQDEGTDVLEGWLRMAQLERLSRRQDLLALAHAVHATVQLMLQARTLNRLLGNVQMRQDIAATLEKMAEIFLQGAYPVDIDLPLSPSDQMAPAAVEALAAMRSTLVHFADAVPAPADVDPHARFLAADAFTNPVHVRFALKGTAAAMFCYLLYNALDWPGIHTAFITCFIVGLTTTAETVQKLTLRITGCLLGAALGVASLLWVLPHVDTLSGLLSLLFGVSLAATWIAAGSPRIAYIGFQLAFAFYLCVLQGNGPGYDLVVARDRVLGILIGNAVMYLVFTRIWPASVAERIDPALSTLLRRLARIAAAPQSRTAIMQGSRVDQQRVDIMGNLDLLKYEPPRIRPDAEWVAQRQCTFEAATSLQSALAARQEAAALAPVLDLLADRIGLADEISPLPPEWAERLPSELKQSARMLADAVQGQTNHHETHHAAC